MGALISSLVIKMSVTGSTSAQALRLLDANSGAEASTSALYTSALAVGDVDNDGDVDVIVGHQGQNRSTSTKGEDDGLGQQGIAFEDDYAYARSSLWTLTWTVTSTCSSLTKVLLCITGRMGLATFTDDGVSELMNPPNNITGLSVADFDGDGAADFALSYSRTGPCVLRDASATPLKALKVMRLAHAPQASAIRSGDFNGDGTQDLVMASKDAPLTLFFNTGARSYGGRVDADLALTSGDSRAIALETWTATGMSTSSSPIEMLPTPW